MAQVTVDIAEEQAEALNRYAASRGVTAASLIAEYVAYLIAGGESVHDLAPTSEELACLAEQGGAFDWLSDEPELYSLADGEPV